MTDSFAQDVDVNSTAAVTTSSAECAALVLDAIRSRRPADVEVCLRAMPDRQAFFATHCAELAQAALHDGSGACLAVLLKMGFCSNEELIHRISTEGNPQQLKILREYTDKSDMLKRWIRESSHFSQKFRYRIKSVF